MKTELTLRLADVHLLVLAWHQQTASYTASMYAPDSRQPQSDSALKAMAFSDSPPRVDDAKDGEGIWLGRCFFSLPNADDRSAVRAFITSHRVQAAVEGPATGAALLSATGHADAVLTDQQPYERGERDYVHHVTQDVAE